MECVSVAARDLAQVFVQQGYPLADDKARLMTTCSTVADRINSRTRGITGRHTKVADKLGIEYRCTAKRTTKGGDQTWSIPQASAAAAEDGALPRHGWVDQGSGYQGLSSRRAVWEGGSWS